MSATRDGKMWRCQFYYKDWQGVSHKKNKRGFRTKGEAEQWERDFLQQQERNLDINFENFVRIYYDDMEHRLRENTMRTKKFIIDLKIIPYFRKKCISEIKASDIRAWQNALIKEGYSDTYLKTVNNQLAAIFNYAVRYYDLKDNPCRKAGSIGKSHAGEKGFWTKGEFKQFLSGRDIITPPKTPKSKRNITIPPFLAEELKEYTSRLYGIMEDERMFRFTKSYMEHEIIKGIQKSGVKRIRLHDLRHSHASMLVEMGFTPLAIAERLGHEKIETTLNTYSHLYPNKQGNSRSSWNLKTARRKRNERST